MPGRPHSTGAQTGRGVDLTTAIGSVRLRDPFMNASGTGGLGVELARYCDFGRLGAFVVKSLASFEWDGNPAPRVHQMPGGMINSVGLSGPGVAAWIRDELPSLRATGVPIVLSIWGRSSDDYAAAAAAAAPIAAELTAIEVNLSCPNLSGKAIIAHDAEASASVISAVCAALASNATVGLPVWAKLSPNTDRLVAVAGAVAGAGADAVVLTNTLLGLSLDLDARRPVLGAGPGGVSGTAVHAVAIRATWLVRQAYPDLPIIGVGGIWSGTDAIEFLMAGASAVQVGTALFEDPRGIDRIRSEVIEWCTDHGVASVSELIGAAQPVT